MCVLPCVPRAFVCVLPCVRTHLTHSLSLPVSRFFRDSDSESSSSSGSDSEDDKWGSSSDDDGGSDSGSDSEGGHASGGGAQQKGRSQYLQGGGAGGDGDDSSDDDEDGTRVVLSAKQRKLEEVREAVQTLIAHVNKADWVAAQKGTHVVAQRSAARLTQRAQTTTR